VAHVASDRHGALWAVHQPLDCPDTMCGVPRGTAIRATIRRRSAAYGPHHELRPDGG